MGKFLLLAVGAGLASAILNLSVMSGSPVGLPLAYLAPLPLFLVAFSQGHTSVAIAAVCGSITMTAVIGPIMGAAFFLTTGLAPMILSRQALQWREGTDGSQNWYPVGRLLTLLAGLTAIFFLMVLAGFSTHDGGLPKAVELYMLEAANNYDQLAGENQTPAMTTFAEAIRNAAPEASRMLPGMVALSWMLSVMLNGVLAQSILTRSERNFRPTPEYAQLELPRALSYGVTATLVLSFFPGIVGFAAGTLAAILIWPYFILGLIVIHVISRRFSARYMLLAAVYLILLALAWPAALVAGIGLMDQWMGLRRQYGIPSDDQEKE